MADEQMGYGQALALTLETISPLADAWVDLAESADRVAWEDLFSRVDSPSSDSSMKDGYAVRSGDVEGATPERVVFLTVVGEAAAGNPARERVEPGTAVRIQTGAKIPDGADAVLAGEFAVRNGQRIAVTNNARSGRNILGKGTDVEAGEVLVARGARLAPGMIGILASGGHGRVRVFRRPRVAIIATGDELVRLGQPLPEGKLYASNIEIINAWCRRLGMETTGAILGDTMDRIGRNLAEVAETHDAVITSGGAWTGDRDFVAKTLDALGWRRVFHRIRMGPGKAVGFGTLNGKPVFLLPGGPPSNMMAFLQIVLPGLLRLGGHSDPALPRMTVELGKELVGRNASWTHFEYGAFRTENSRTLFDPLHIASRLKAMALAQGVVAIPEGVERLPAGTVVSAQLLT